MRAPEGDLAGLLRWGTGALAAAGVPSPDVDAELLLAHALGLGRGELRVRVVTGTREPTDLERAAFTAAVARRATREPLQHITGTAAFRRLELAVGPGVFVPRPETELLAELGIEALRAVPLPHPVAVDLGTGSGALALAIATEVLNARVTAIEREPAAYEWARRNRDALSPGTRILLGDLAELGSGALAPELAGAVHVVVANPPYIPDAAVPRDPEVQRYDPPAALYGGEDGLDTVHAVSRTAARLLVPGGFLAVEHADVQGDAVRALLAADGWRAPATHRDLLGRDRVTTALR